MPPTTDAQPAAPSPAAEPLAALPVSPVRERISALHGEELTHYQTTGELPEDKSTPTADPSPAIEPTQAAGPSPDAENGPESASGKDEHQEHVPVNESDQQRLRREANKKRWDDLIEERGQLKAKVEIYEKQLAAGTAPKTPIDNPEKPAVSADALPDLDDYLENSKTAKQWQQDFAAAVLTKANAAMDARLNQQTAQTRTESGWQQQLNAGEAAHGKEFRKIAFEAPFSSIGLEQVQLHPQGAAIAYYLGLPENAEEAKELMADTGIDGLDLAALYKAAQHDPKIYARVLEMRGAVKARFQAIAKTLNSKAPADTKPVTSGKLPPSSTVQVPSKGTAVGDPIDDALKRKDTRSYIQLMNDQERRELKNR